MPTPEPLFLSYSRLDGVECALRLADKLVAGPPSIPVWLDQRAMRPGEDWDEQIVEALRTCRGVLFLMTADSVKAKSVCKDEWVRALRYKKPIIPLRLHRAAELPFRLGSRHYIDLEPFDAGLARLREHVAWMDSPRGVLRALEHRLMDAERELPRAPEDQHARIQEEMADLTRQIAQQTSIIENPQAAVERVNVSLERAIEREREPVKPAPAVTPPGKVINPPPVVAPAWFQNRHVETGIIGDFLRDDALRVMTVVGRGGAGKSALVCRLLRSLESAKLPDEGGPLAVDGIVYLSHARSQHRVTVPDLFAGLCRLLTQEMATRLESVYRNPQVHTQEAIRLLLEAFPQGRTVVLMDNFEDALDPSGRIQDGDLDQALRAILEHSRNGLKVIITTRSAPTELAQVQPGRQRRLDLDTGLEYPFAENMLRSMDSDGKVGLREAPHALLGQARERTRGNPRALEALFGILFADPTTNLVEILQDAQRLLPERVVGALVGEAFSRLDPPSQRVMQTLAIYRYPVPPAAIDYLLAPYVVGIDSGPTLSRLVNMQFVRREAGRYYLHQIDRDYALSRLPSGEGEDANPEELTQLGMRTRAAEWFKETRKPRDEWKTLEDLRPQLAEFELRCEVGDYDAAADVLREFDDDSLILWGHYGLVVQLHERLQGRLTDEVLERMGLGTMGVAFWRLGRFQQATTCTEQALALARKQQNRSDEGIYVGYLAGLRADQGDVDGSIPLTELALAIARETKDREGEATQLGNLANRYTDLGSLEKAISLYDQTLAIDRELSDGANEAHDLANLALALRDLGELDKAVLTARMSHTLAVATGNRLIETAALSYLGEILVNRGSLAEAETCLRQALELADAASLVEFQVESRRTLALALLRRGELEPALEIALAALQHPAPRSEKDVLVLLGTILVRQGRSQQARERFRAARAAAHALLNRSPKLVRALLCEALALCGLAVTDGRRHLSDATRAFQAARQVTSSPGTVAMMLAELDDLAPADPEGILAGLRAVASGSIP